MDNNNDFLYLIARLMHSKSVQHIRNDIKKLGNFYVNLIGRFDFSKTKKDIEAQSKGMKINVTPDVNSKGVQSATKQAMNNAQKVANTNKVKVGFELDREKLVNEIKILGKNHSKLYGDSGMTAKYNNLLDSAKLAQSKAELKSLRKQLSAFKVELKATGNDGLNWATKLKESIKRYASFFSGASFVYSVTGQLRNAWEEAKTLDDVYTDLIKVQGELSRSDYPDYLENCNKKAQKLATTQQALIEGATEFSKSGYSIKESDALTEKSTILSNVGDMSASDSAKAIISGVQAYDVIDGYDDVVGKAGALIDKYNEIGNTASITTAEIAEGVQSVGSVFADANTSVDEFIALLAAGNRQYQNADSLSLGLRTAALRIRGCTAELKSMGEETEGVYTSASDLEDKIAGLTNIDGTGGVKILEADGETFRSIYDIFLDISEVYQDMSDTDQSALLDLIAGTHRASSISAVLNNMSEAQEIYKRSLEATGSAQEEYEKYLESSEASLNRFKSSMTETYQNIINGNTVKNIADIGTNTLNLANDFGIVEGSIRGILLLGVGKFLTTTSMAFVQGTKSVERYGQALRMVNNIPNGNQRYDYLKQLASVTKTLTNEQLKQVLSNKRLNQQEKIRVLQLSGLGKKAATAKLAEMGLTQATQAQTVANNANILSIEGIKNAMVGMMTTIRGWFMSNPVGIALMGISIGVSAISAAISNHNQKIEEQKARTAEMTEAWKSENASLNESITSYQELQKKLKDTTLTVDEAKSVKEELATIQDSLTAKYSAEVSGIDLVNGKYDEQIEKLRELSAEKAKEYNIAQNASVVEDDRKYLTETVAVSMKLGDNDFEGLESYLSKNGLSKTFLAKDGFYIGGVGTREALYNQLVNLYSDVAEDFGSDTDNSAVKAFQLALSDVINNSFDKDEMEQAKSNVQAFAEAELLSNSKGRELYDRATEAVSSYNEALASGKGVDEAKSNLKAIRREVDNMTLNIYGSGDVFESIFEGISESASDTAKNINNSFVDKGFSKSKMISELNDMSESFESLGKIYESVSDSDPFDFKLLDDEKFKSAFSGLGDVYTDFVEQVASTPNDINACQSAFDELVTEWIKSLNILEGVTKENANLTVSMLEQMGVTNAREIVDQMFTIVSEESQILNDAEAEFLATYQNYLASKDEADLAYLESSASKNGQLVSALGESYLQDYKNWCDLLSKKAEAYNELVKAVGGSYNSAVSTVDNLMANGITPTMSSITAAEAAKGQYQMVSEAANKAKDSLKLDLSTIKTDFGSSYKPTSVSSGSGSSASKSKETAETFDWIKNKVEAVQRVIANLGKTVSATYKSWTKRNSAMSEQISKINEEISVQQQAYAKYMSMANGVGLSTHYQELVKNGAMDISTITDETLIEKIKSFEEFYDKAINCQDAIADLNDELAELARTQFDNLDKQFKNIESEIQHEIDMVEGYIDQVEARGYIESKSAYESLIKSAQENVDLLTEKYSALVQQRDEAVRIGKADMYSEYWFDLTEEIYEVESALQDANTSLVELNKNIRDLEWDRFDRVRDMISQITDEADFFIELMSDKDLFDEDGNITEHGEATMGLHLTNMRVHEAEAKAYAEEITKINEALAKDPYNVELLERKEELTQSHRDAILAARDERKEMIELATEGYNKMLESLNKLIDKRKEYLQLEKDAYDYQNKINEQVSEVERLEKIVQALSGDTSEEGMLRLQQSNKKLEEAREALEQTEYEKFIDDQNKMLDELYINAQQWVDQRLSNEEKLLSDIATKTEQNTSTIKTTVETEARAVGTSFSTTMAGILSGDGSESSITSNLEKIKEYVAAMAESSDKEASTQSPNSGNGTSGSENKNPGSSVSTPSSGNNSSSTSTTPRTPTASSANTIKVGGRINASGAKIYDYAGSTNGKSQYYKNDPYYTVLDQKDNYLKVRHHSLSSGVTGWFKKSDVKAYKTGGLVDYTGFAWVDGQKKKPEAFLNAQDTENISELKNVLREVDPLQLKSLTMDQIKEFTSTMDGFKPIVESIVKRPDFVPSPMNQSIVNHFNIEMYGVNDVQTFAQQIKDAYTSNARNVRTMFKEDIYSGMLGKNSLEVMKYR